jgi:tetratricopeptide (TPR) repeat protein
MRFLCLSLLLAISATGATPAESAEARFAEALELAKTDRDAAEVRFRAAAEHYELILQQEGIDRGKVLANAGRARFMAGDLGPAIAHLRSSQQLRPWDSALRQDLAYVRSQTLDLVEPSWLRRVLNAVERVPVGWRFAGLALAYALFWLTWLGGRLACCPRAMQATHRLAVILAVVSVLLLALEPLRRSFCREAVVVAPSAVARKGDASVYESAFVTPLHSGTECRILKERGNWLQVALASGETCWLPSDAVAVIGE